MSKKITVKIKYPKAANDLDEIIKTSLIRVLKFSELSDCIVFDYSLSPGISEAIEDVTDELFRAIEKFPAWPTEKHGGGNYVKAAAIIAEESGELIRAALKHEDEDGTIEMMREEAIQTAAMALRFLINLPEKKSPAEA